MISSVFDGYHADTTPGADSPYSPPANWHGDDKQYLVWLRGEFEHSPLVRQRMALLARDNAKGVPITYDGPYVKALADAVISIRRRFCEAS